ncbi:MAG: U32 family peptidase [Coriobacteriia bacterium]|nr:U32 family peptidase [Coriobacteriia bacterium]
MANKIELLAPAGGLEQLKYAIAYGADAVYMAGSRYGLRVRATNFHGDEALKEAIDYAHAHNTKVHVTVNAIMHEDDLVGLPEYLTELNDMGADALIVNDLATIMLAKQHAKNCDIHVSTQASITNSLAARTYYEMGASRVVLARELSLEAIKKIRSEVPQDLEIEAFVHGSVCMAYSGRCIISCRLTGRDASRGHCSQPCRWKYALVEEKRPGKYIPVEEDGRGSYIMNSEDLMMLEHLEELKDAGVSSFKIEGRVKSAYYVGTITNAYRQVLDGADPALYLPEVLSVSHRPYSQGFYYGDAKQADEINGYIAEAEWTARVDEVSQVQKDYFKELPFVYQDIATHMGAGPYYKVLVTLKNKFSPEDELELLNPGKPGEKLSIYGLMMLDGGGVHAVDEASNGSKSYIFFTNQYIDETSIIRTRLKELKRS